MDNFDSTSVSSLTSMIEVLLQGYHIIQIPIVKVSTSVRLHPQTTTHSPIQLHLAQSHTSQPH